MDSNTWLFNGNAKNSSFKFKKCSKPEFSDNRYINLKRARHPLLDPKKVVPIDVYIGDESEFDPDVTIIKTHYKVDNDEGTLAIIGPKRMEYDKVVTLLNFLKDYIEK